MTVDRFRADTESWGCLVKSWATKLDYIGAGTFNNTAFAAQPPRVPWGPPATDAGKPWALPPLTAVPVPAQSGGTVNLPLAIALTRQQFLDRLTAASTQNVYLPAQYQNVVIVQGSVDTMVVRLPPMDILQESEDDIIRNGYTDPPSFYQDLYSTKGMPSVGPFMPSGQTDEMKLHANRIGDYTLNSCS
jgi:hypothetical protein